MDTLPRNKHIIDLAEEIIDNIELSQIEVVAVLFKASRLARFVDNEEIRTWLKYELNGYKKDEPLFEKLMKKSGRIFIIEGEKKEYIAALSFLEANITSSKAKMQQIAVPSSLAGDHALTTARLVSNTIIAIANQAVYSEGIKSRVLAQIHEFATSIYYERIFDGFAENIFDSYKKQIDLLIAENLGTVIEQIPVVISRLSDNSPESISHALTTCRRIIDSFADHIFPARPEPIQVGGVEISLKQDKVVNRIETYVRENCTSDSRITRIRQNLKNLYGRVSAGVHSEVDAYEAKNLFFNVYLILGEILGLKGKVLATEDEVKIDIIS